MSRPLEVMMRAQWSDPNVRALGEALLQVLPDDGVPEYQSRSALDICVAGHWQADPLLAAAIECGQRYWAGKASEDEREAMRDDVVRHAESLRKEGGPSPQWCRCGMAMSALDVRTPSNGFLSDHLLTFALEAGVPLASVRQALEMHVPGFSAAIRRLLP